MIDEFDELRAAWQSEIAQNNVQSHELQAILRRKTDNTLSVLRRNLGRDTLLNVLTAIVMVVFMCSYTPRDNGMYYAIAQMTLLITVPYLFFYVSMQQVLKQTNVEGQHLVAALQRILVHWEQSAKITIGLSICLSPAIFLSLFWFLGSIEHVNPGKVLGWSTGPLLIVGLSVVASLLFKWWIQRLYGRHIAQIRAYLAELES